MAQLNNFCLQTIQTGVQALVEEFSELKVQTQQCPSKAAFDLNITKNRYKGFFKNKFSYVNTPEL